MNAQAETAPPQTERRFVGNAAISTVLHFTSTFAVLAVTPLLVGRLGLEAYGLWALLNTAIRYSLLADIGLGPSITKHVAGFVTLGEERSIRATTTIGMVYLGATGVLIVLGAALVGPIVFAHLSLSGGLRPEASSLFVALMGSVALNFAFWGSPGATLTGRGHYRYTSALNALGSVVFAIAAVALELLGDGLRGLVVATYVQVGVTATLGFIVLRRLGGPVFCNPFTIRRSLYGAILRFGGWVQLSAVAWLIIADTPAIIVGFTVGLEYVGVLDLATRLAKSVRALAFNFNNALLPTVSALGAEADGLRAAAFVPRATRLLGLLALASSGALIASAPFILRVWIGPSLPHEGLLLAVLLTLAPAYTVETMTSVASAAARGLGRPSLDTHFALTYAGVSLIATLVLVRTVGLEGVAVAGLLGALAGSLAFFRAAGTMPALRFDALIGRWLGPAVLTVAFAVVVAWLVGRLLLDGVATRPAALLATLIVWLVYGGAIALGARFLHVIDERDLEGLRAVLPRRVARLLNA